jgi:hypothetical protein
MLLLAIIMMAARIAIVEPVHCDLLRCSMQVADLAESYGTVMVSTIQKTIPWEPSN